MANEEMTDLKVVKIKLVDDYQLSIGEKINSSKKASEVAIKTIAKEVGSFDREVLFSLNLTTKNEVINASMIHMGSINSSVAHPREIFKASILSNAAKVILFHNHPSGNLTPSQADIDFTKRIIATGEVLGIEVLDHLVVNQLGDYLSINSEFDMTLDKSLVLETATSWAEIKEENEKTTPTNQEKFQILSRRKDYLKREKLNLELEAISYIDTSKVDSEIKKIDEVINGFLSKEQKEHIIEFLKTQGEGEHIRSEESNSYWNDIYYGGVPLTVKMVESDYYMNVYKAWGNFLIEEFKNGNISWDSLINAGYEPNKEIEFYKKHEKNIDNQPIYRRVIAVEEKTSSSLVFEVRKYELPKLHLIDLQGKIINTFDEWNDRLLNFGNYFFDKHVTDDKDYEYIVEETQRLNPEYTFNVDHELILTRNLSLENRVSVPSLENYYMIEEPKATYSRETKKQELEALTKVVQDKVNSFVRNPELIKDFLLFKRQFPNYSAKNTMLIYSQKPTALGVGAYGFWKQKGYPVKRGEKGIRIYSPMTSEMLLDSNGKIVTTLEKATEEEKNLLKIGRYTKRTIVSGYQPKVVFDISQTTAPLESYPELVRKGYELENITNYQIQNIALNSLMKEQNIQFVDYDKGRVGLNTYGYYIPASDEIFLQPDLTSVARFKTLSHELAHGMLHKTSKLSKEAEEFQAQMVSVIVSDTLQIPVKDEDYGYIKDYSEKLSEVERRELTEEVLEVANQILEKFENTLQKVQSQEFTKEEKQELERLGLSERSILSFTDKLEVLQFPSNDNQKMTLAKKIIDDSISKLPKEEQEVKRNEEETFLRNKVKEKHPYYRIGLLEEAVIKQTDSQQIEVTMISINGKETKQVFDEEEQVIELLQKKEAYPAPDTAMTYVKTSIEMKHTQERHLHQNQQKEQERQL